MKRIAAISLILVALLGLGSCYWRPDFSSGSFSVSVAGITPRFEGEVIRIYLIADGLLFSTGGGVPFAAEVPLTVDYDNWQDVLISGLPVGPKYKAMIGIGMLSAGVFTLDRYGESALFQVNPNADTAVTVDLSWFSLPGQFSYSADLLGKNLKDVLDSDTYVFAAETQRINNTYWESFSGTWYLQTPYDLAADPDEQGVSGYRINGFSRGDLYSSNYLDTTNGILPFTEGSGVYTFNKAFSGTLGGDRNILESGSAVVQPTGSDYAVFFRRANGLGGAYVASSAYPYPETWNWVNLDVTGVSDLAVSGYNAYYAANGNAFALPPAFLQDADLALHRVDLPVPAPVLSVGFRPAMSLPATLSFGTTDGVYQATVSETTAYPTAALSPPTPTLVAGTEGDSIERIAISTGDSYTEAYLSRYYLYIKNFYGLYKIPFFAVIPGKATGLAWDSTGTLYISGTEGLAAVYVGYYAS